MVCQFHVPELQNRKNLPEELALFNLKQKLLAGRDPAGLATEEKWLLLLKYAVWHDPDRARHEDCLCPVNLKPIRCANPNCRHWFKPHCRSELFCCLDCFLNADFDRIALLIIRYRGNVKKARLYLNKLRYRATEQGRVSRMKENRKWNTKRTAKKHEPVAAEPFKPPLEIDLDEAVRAFLFGLDRSKRQCKCIGCTNIRGEKVNGIEPSYCNVECREFQKKRRRDMRAVKPDEQCPIAAYVETIIEIIRS